MDSLYITISNENKHLLEKFIGFCNKNRWYTGMISTKDGWIFSFEFSNNKYYEETKSEISRLFPTLFL